jgi:ABC-type sugar transport system ATPase subunit
MNENSCLEIKNISKEFPGVKALDNISINIKSGEIMALVGENGAGKSTLMKILSGVYPYGTYQGSFTFLGKEMKFTSIKDSENAGIQIIYQELALCKLMNVVENIFLGNEIKNKLGSIDLNESITKAAEYCKSVGLAVDVTTPVIQLGIGQQQLVEVAKAMSRNIKILILDEPTSTLAEHEINNLFNIMKTLKNLGISCIFITHKIGEVFRCADRITVIRDGKVISVSSINETSENKIIVQMVGRELDQRFPREPHKSGKAILELKNWTVKDPELPERNLIEDVSFIVKEGEVLGIAGLGGAGRTELAMSIFGCYSGYTFGKIIMNNHEIKINSPIDAIKLGISYLTEDRKRYGLNLLMDIKDNITLASMNKISKYGIVNNVKKILSANKAIVNMLIKTPSNEQVVGLLSGGNQQKVVFGKWINTEPKVLLLDEPTRGIDVGAKYEIYTLINKMVAQGVCVVMISSELPEIIGMSDRVLVMHEGKIVADLDRDETNQEEIMYYATGGGANS